MPRNAVEKAFNLGWKEHKLSVIDPSTAKDSLQVIGAGLPRSGTTSLRAALQILGYDPCHHMIDCMDYPKRSDDFTELLESQDYNDPSSINDPARLAKLRVLMQGYKATVDAPTADLVRELLAIFPRAKVVLSVRDSKEAWWQSFRSTLDVQFHPLYTFLVYPVSVLRKQNGLGYSIINKWRDYGGGYGPEKHDRHTAEVKSWVPADQLLMFNNKQGWEPLCKFLEVPVPKDVPFPHLNDSEAIRKALSGAQMMGAMYWLGYALAAGAIVWSTPRLINIYGGFFGL